MDTEELDATRDRCTRFLNWHGPGRPAEMLSEIPPDTVPDRYGDGGAVAELEGEVAALLGKPSAVFLPSGTTAQQAALRVHADRRDRRVVLFHPLCHLDWHEGEAYRRLHGLVGRPVGLCPLGPTPPPALAARRRPLPLIPGSFARPRALAAAPGDVPGVGAAPAPPRTPMMHLFLRTTAEAFEAAAVKLAEDEGI